MGATLMKISIIEPLERAYEHMKGMLFAPFDLGKWMAIGFACWLARLTEASYGGGFPSWTIDLIPDDAEAATFSRQEWDPLRDLGWQLGCGAMAFGLLALLAALILLLLWLSSRGHFVFLDDVIHDRAEIREPWSRFAALGTSLFLWRLGFFFVALILTAALAAPLIYVIYALSNRGSFALGDAAMVTACALPVVILAVTVAYTQVFLLHFVVPIMHREGVSAGAAWGRFLPLLRRHLGSFLVYGLFVFALWLGVLIALALVVIFSCCIAAVPLVIPYVGTVALLPVYVVFRAYSVEFLGQMMPEVALPRAAAEGAAAG